MAVSTMLRCVSPASSVTTATRASTANGIRDVLGPNGLLTPDRTLARGTLQMAGTTELTSQMPTVLQTYGTTRRAPFTRAVPMAPTALPSPAVV